MTSKPMTWEELHERLDVYLEQAGLDTSWEGAQHLLAMFRLFFVEPVRNDRGEYVVTTNKDTPCRYEIEALFRGAGMLRSDWFEKKEETK